MSIRRSTGLAMVVLGLAASAALAEIKGRVVDASGRPMPGVSVGFGEFHKDFPLSDGFRQVKADAEGRFSLPALAPGDYDVMPVPAGKPLAATFYTRKLTIERGDQPDVDLELKAVPHATLTVRFVNTLGTPAPAGTGYRISGQHDEAEMWETAFRPVPGRFDALTAIVPIGLDSPGVEFEDDSVWWTWGPGGTKQAFSGIRLKKVDGDHPDIVAQRVGSATLEIRVKAKEGELPEDVKVTVHYPRKDGADGGPYAEQVRPGVFRLDRELLPGREAEVHVTAKGFKHFFTKPFQFTREGQSGYIEATITLGQDVGRGWKMKDAVEVTLRAMDGTPIPQPAGGSGPTMAIACRAVDLKTGLPVVGAEVTFSVEQWRDEEGEEESKTLDERIIKSDDDGRFTVRVPLKYLPDPSPKRRLEVRVEIRHPRYVETFETAWTKDLIEKGVSDDFPEFRLMKLAPARTVTGRVLDPDGKPMAKVYLYKEVQDFKAPRDAGFPKTDAEGRFRTNVAVGTALKLSIHAANLARTTVDVAADATDLGDIRLARGNAISGRVLDGDGKPVQGLSVTIGKDEPPRRSGLITISSSIVYPTNKAGEFRAADLAPGKYLVKVGAIFQDENGKNTGLAVKDAPGVYVNLPLEVVPGKPNPDLTIRPVPEVRFVATLETTRPKLKEDEERVEEDPKPKTDQEQAADWYEVFAEIPAFAVRGKVAGVAWTSEFSWLASSEKPGVYPGRVPKGLEEATIAFGGFPQRFRLDPKGPELFGPVVKVGRVDADRPEIHVRRYRKTVLRLDVASGDGKLPDGVKVEAHYAREPEMKAAGVEFGEAPLIAIGSEGKYRLSILPDEDVDLTVTAPGYAPTATRVKLVEGETRTVPISIKPGR